MNRVILADPVGLLRAQGLDGIHSGGTARGQIAGEGRGGEQAEGHASITCIVVGIVPENTKGDR